MDNKRIAGELMRLAKVLLSSERKAVRTVEVPIYDIDDVKKDRDLREKVLTEYRYINVDFGWSDFVLDDYKRGLEKLGFKDVDIKFTGFGSQGDGASFTGRISAMDAVKLLRVPISRKFQEALDDKEVEYTIERSGGRHFHEKSITVDFNDNGTQDLNESWERVVDKKIQDISDDLYKWLVDKNKEIYKGLEQHYEHLISDDEVFNTLELNGYEFNERGEEV